MGLFTNKKKGCPICGDPTPRILPTKIEDMPICKACDQKIDLPDGMAAQMSLDAFRQYLAFYEENRSLLSSFTETSRYNFHFLWDDIVVDANHGLFRLKGKPDGLIFEASCLKGFRMWEDRNLLFEGDKAALRCGGSDVPDRVYAREREIERFLYDHREYERMEQRERMMEQRDREEGRAHHSHPYIPEPRFDIQGPIRKFRMEIVMDHPYWNGFQKEWDAPTFSTTYPRIDEYLNEYNREVDDLYALACGLMTLINPNAQELQVNQGAAAVQNTIPEINVTIQSPVSGDAVGEIKKYKELLDAGVITEEEFSAKKRQLLGI